MFLNNEQLDNLFNEESEKNISDSQSIDDNLLDEKENVNIEEVYLELANLIKNGNKILSDVSYIIETEANPESVTGAASLINAVKDTLKEFTKLHNNEIRFKQQKELELIKFKSREKLLEKKAELSKQLFDNKNNEIPLNSDENSTELLPFCQESIVDLIIEKESKK